jgi:predicted MPP superfamily phosphohydrolase
MRLALILAVLTLATVGAALPLRSTYPGAWRRWLARTMFVLYVTAFVAVVVSRVARGADIDDVARIATTLATCGLVSAIALLLSGPFYATAARIVDAMHKRKKPPDPQRRAFLRGALTVVPASAAMTGPSGALSASMRPVLRHITIESHSVPKALDGLKILHISDVHLGTFIEVAQVEAVVEQAAAYKPDLVALTGDIADDFELLPAALAKLASLRTPLGMYGCIGNHEIHHGREEAAQLFREGGVHFLEGEGILVEHNGARLWIAGADDPAALGQEHRPFLEKTVAASLEKCADDVTCRVLLCHRPEGFEAAARRRVTLTLSGHTHGAQMAMFGRSLLEWVLPQSYLLGTYQRGDSALYTTAGLGHWFPFRFNCPCEAALVTLRTRV